MATTTPAHGNAMLTKLWKVETYSSGPLGIGDGVIYAPLLEGEKHFAALDTATGAPRWKTRGYGSLPPRFAAVVTEGAVVIQKYAPTRPKVLMVVDRQSGQTLRDVRCAGPEPSALDGTSAHVYGPFRIGQLVVCGTYGPLAQALRDANRHADPPPRGHVTASDPLTGKVAWDVELPEGMVTHNVLSDGERIFVGGRQTAAGTSDENQDWQGRLLALRGSDGKKLWESEPGPALNGAGDGVVLADMRGTRTRPQHTAVSDYAPNELVAFDAATGAIRFRRTMLTGWTSFITGDRVICVDPHTDGAVALDITTGAELWAAPSPHPAELRQPSATIHGRSFAACAGCVWITGSQGRMIGFDLATGAFHRTNVRGFTLASDGQRLFVGDAASLTAFGF